MNLTKKQIKDIIEDEIEVDCYEDHEVNMGWAIYMEDHIYYPFEAEYLVKKKSGKNEWKKVRVIDNKTDEDSFTGGDYYVNIELDDMILSTRIDDLQNIKANEETMQALQVWESRNAY